jgi:hypothetical protein
MKFIVSATNRSHAAPSALGTFIVHISLGLRFATPQAFAPSALGISSP